MYNNNFRMICIPVFSPCKRNWDNQGNNNCGGRCGNKWNSFEFYGSINYRNNREHNFYANNNQNNGNYGGCGCGNNYPETWEGFRNNQFNDFNNQNQFGY